MPYSSLTKPRNPGYLRRGLTSPYLLVPLCLAFVVACLPAAAAEQRGIPYPMTASAWGLAPPIGWVGTVPGSLRFARYEGMPAGTLTVNEAVAASTDARFSNGTIDFDIKPLAYSDTGIIFRRHGNEAGEIVYLRGNPDCPVADDCIQYAPITHGLMQWDIYSDQEGPAPIAPTGWNHVRLLISGEKMLVYVNHQVEPSLVVPKLQGLTADGGIALKGPAIFANLVIRPGSPPALATVHQPSPDPRAVTAWLAAPPGALTVDRPIPASAVPRPDAWRPIAAEPDGLVNLSRTFGVGQAPSTSVGWLKTVVTASAPTRRTIRIGWVRQLSVFLNGRLVFSGDNPYYPADRRLSPNGRLEADNASIPLDLRQGRNDIVLAVGNGWRTQAGVEKAGFYGWAAEAHFDELAGIKLQGK